MSEFVNKTCCKSPAIGQESNAYIRRKKDDNSLILVSKQA